MIEINLSITEKKRSYFFFFINRQFSLIVGLNRVNYECFL